MNFVMIHMVIKIDQQSEVFIIDVRTCDYAISTIIFFHCEIGESVV